MPDTGRSTRYVPPMATPSRRVLVLSAAGLAVAVAAGVGIGLALGDDDDGPSGAAATSSESATPSPTTISASPTASSSPSTTPTATPSTTVTPSSSASPSASTSATASPSASASATPSAAPTRRSAFLGLNGPLPCADLGRGCSYAGAPQGSSVSPGPRTQAVTVEGPGSIRLTWVPGAATARPAIVGFVIRVKDVAGTRLVREVRLGTAARSLDLRDLPIGRLSVQVQELNAAGLSAGFVTTFATGPAATAAPTLSPAPTASPAPTP